MQRKCACGGSAGVTSECEDCDKKKLSLQRSTEVARPATLNSKPETRNSSGVPPIVNEILSSPGQPLDSQTRAFFEPRFGHDFSRVRVHTDANAAESASAVNALAYTVGRDVAFGAGQFAPQTNAGRKLLAHELTHVVQQRSVSSPETGGNEGRSVTVSPSPGALEVEAHRMAESYNWNEPPVGGLSQRILQRQEAPAAAPEAPAAAPEAPAAPAVCPVTAIAPYGPPDGPAVGNEGMTAATITAMECLQTAVTAAAGTMHVTTRFRTQAYQDHLVAVWDSVNAPARAEPECAAVMQNYATERATHFPMGAPARGVSNHTTGTAFDATVTLPATANLDTIKAGCNLTTPVAGEPWHYET
ncbi:MAG: DUF4157 domain-containing protein [Pyrinomonadaceae bacterium]|nr:DUF4157 domain-containing protein [Pyrinomonadaceae bacterium]